MKVVLGSDHRGFTLKQDIKNHLLHTNYQVLDMGDLISTAHDDYPDFAHAAAREVVSQPDWKGIVVCGSGVGVAITANKVRGIRCGLGVTPEQIIAARRDDNINMLAVAADFFDK